MASFPDLLLRLDAIVPSNNSIEKIFGLMLYGAVKHARPSVVLELGTAVGYSTAWMLLALNENEYGHIYAVDLVASDNPIWKQVGLDTSRLTYLSNDFIDTLREDSRLPPVFDLVFHDAGHNVAEVEKDLAWVLPRLAVGGSLVVHDTVYSPQIGESLRRFFESPERQDFWKFESIDEASGVGIATRLKLEEKIDEKQTEIPKRVQRKRKNSRKVLVKGSKNGKVLVMDRNYER